MNASLILRRIEDELRFPIFLRHGVIATHGHRSIGVAIGSHADAEYDRVQNISQRSNYQDGGNRSEKYSPQPFSQIRGHD